MFRHVFLLVLASNLLAAASAWAGSPPQDLERQLLPLARILTGADENFELSAKISFGSSEDPQIVHVRLNRNGSGQFELAAVHPDYAVEIRRSAEATAFVLPLHKVVYRGEGVVNESNSLAPRGFLMRTCASGTRASQYLPLLSADHPEALVKLVSALLPQTALVTDDKEHAEHRRYLRPLDDRDGLAFSFGSFTVEATTGPATPMKSLSEFGSMRVVTLEREELESQLARGSRRALEILLPSTSLLKPVQNPRRVPHGELRWKDGQRIVLLSGSPEEIGAAHGQLLKEEAMRCMDSVLNVFGTLQTVRSGRWFRDDLHEAAARLLPHIPERHRRETLALAASLNFDPVLVEELNVFPELFHCSGFAVFGSATIDGKLYHGRVLDYMTMIGLQDAAVTFIIAPEGQIPFANIGYAAFIGSVSGMNLQGISLGEMGGKGEGQWDGVPMATLMRRALEECSTLEEVKTLWQNNPRTCEYYYVFADGKTRQAVGVAARPESIEFVQPGEAHPLLGPGIPDTVVLSAGKRLDALRARVQEKHGSIDEDVGQWLMCRPVAMKSNLHNVLFVPEDGVFYFANADHDHPAADRNYVRLNLPELVKSMQSE